MRRLFLIVAALSVLVLACKPAPELQPTDTATVRGEVRQPEEPTETATVRGIPPVTAAVGDSCDSYLSTAEINAACGTSLGSFETGTGTCDRTYHVSEDTLFAYSVAGPTPEPMATQAYDIAKESRKTIVENQAQYAQSVSVTTPIFEQISGLGDDAYKSDAGNGQLNINFRKGEYSVYLIADPGLCTWTGMESLAKKIAGRLA